MEFGKIERVSLPPMRVASYEVISEAPEEDAQEYVENWLKDKGLKVGENGVRGFGFDCHCRPWNESKTWYIRTCILCFGTCTRECKDDRSGLQRA